MHNKPVTLIILLVIFLAVSCTPSRMTSTIVSANYDKKKVITTYMVFPYGSVDLPGKWEKGKYNSTSKQQYFKKDSAYVTIAIASAEGFPFYKKGLKDCAFVKAFYDWEAQYQSTDLRQNVEILVTDSINNYIIWRTYSDNVNIIWLSSFRNCCDAGAFQNISVNARSWSHDAKVRFLQDLYAGKFSQ